MPSVRHPSPKIRLPAVRILPRLLSLVALVSLSPASAAPADAADGRALREVFADDFLVGAAVSGDLVRERDPRATGLVARHFSSITPENALKWDAIQRAPGRFDFRAGDAAVAFAGRHGLAPVGHTLVWHSQTPAWVFTGPDGAPATRDELLGRMREHIHTVVGRYRGRIKGWDVVNEAISDGEPGGLRDSPWLRLIGEDFIDHAFRFAREADPRVELYYNDYGLENPDKRRHALALLRGLLERGVPVDGVGLQGHYQLDWPSIQLVDETIREFSALGLKVMITELDVDVLPSRGPAGVADIARREGPDPGLDPYPAGLPEEIQTRLAARYADLFRLFLRHRDNLTRVTLWGLGDGESWLNNFPVRGRTNHPLLFDRDLRAKPALAAVLAVGGTPPRPTIPGPRVSTWRQRRR
jgi:endo-1,4-beta-xylanase